MSISDASSRAAGGGLWREGYTDVLEQAVDVAGSFIGSVRRNPLIGVVFGAAAIGALVGWLIAGPGQAGRPRQTASRVERRRKPSFGQALGATRTTAAAVAPFAVHVMRNPFLRGLVIRTALRSLRRARR